MKPADTNDLVYPQALFTGYIVHHKMAWDNFNNSFQIKLILDTQNRNLFHIAKKISTTLKYWVVNLQRDFFCKERMIKNDYPKSQTKVSEMSISQLFLKGVG